MPESFDAAVIARGLGGYICALSLAMRGAKVFLSVPQQIDAPSILYGDGERGMLRQVFRSLGIWGDAEKRIVRPPIAYQVALPGRRMDMYTNPSGLLDEYTREYPEHGKSLRSLFEFLRERNEVLRAFLFKRFFRERRVKSPGFLIYRKFRREKLSALLGDTAGPHPFIPLLLAQTQSWTRGVSQDPFSFETAFHIDSLQGSFRITDGIYNFLKEKISDHRVTMNEGESLTNIIFKGKTPTGLSVGDTAIHAGVLASDDGIESLLPLLTPPLRAKMSNKSAVPQRSTWEYSLHFLIREQALPVGMEDEVVCVPAEGEIKGKNLLRISLLRHTSHPQAGMVPLTVRCVTENETEDVSGEVISALQSLMPFSDVKGHGVVPAGDPPEKGPLYGPLHPQLFNPLIFTPRLPIKGIFHCGRALFPSLGIEGEALAGHYCAQIMSQKM